MAWKIRFYSGLNQGAEVSLGEGRVALGSDPLQADLVLLDEGIAAVHLVLEVGHAIIELRREQERLPDEPCYAEAMPWRQAIRAMGRALIRLFVRPGAENLERALAAVDQAIHAARHTDEPCAPHFDSSPLRRVRSYLHFIRSSLLAPTSPLTELAGRTSGQGTVHAS